jgi:hypothetical protein
MPLQTTREDLAFPTVKRIATAADTVNPLFLAANPGVSKISVGGTYYFPLPTTPVINPRMEQVSAGTSNVTPIKPITSPRMEQITPGVSNAPDGSLSTGGGANNTPRNPPNLPQTILGNIGAGFNWFVGLPRTPEQNQAINVRNAAVNQLTNAIGAVSNSQLGIGTPPWKKDTSPGSNQVLPTGSGNVTRPTQPTSTSIPSKEGFSARDFSYSRPASKDRNTPRTLVNPPPLPANTFESTDIFQNRSYYRVDTDGTIHGTVIDVQSPGGFRDNGQTYQTMDQVKTNTSDQQLQTFFEMDMMGILPNEIPLEWSISDGRTAYDMERMGYKLDVPSSKWILNGGSNYYSNGSYSGGGSYNPDGYQITADDWMSGYRPGYMTVQNATDLGISESWMGEFGYTLIGDKWIKVEKSNPGGGGYNSYPTSSSGYSNYPTTPSVTRRVSTG